MRVRALLRENGKRFAKCRALVPETGVDPTLALDVELSTFPSGEVAALTIMKTAEGPRTLVALRTPEATAAIPATRCVEQIMRSIPFGPLPDASTKMNIPMKLVWNATQ